MSTPFKSPAETSTELLSMLAAFGIELNAGQKTEVTRLIKARMDDYAQANSELALAVYNAALNGADPRRLVGLA